MNTVPEPMRLAMLAFCDALMTSRAPDAIIGPESDPYVHRWHLGPRGDAANCYVHVFYRDDVDRALHDHRYDNTSVVLRNRYLEWSHVEPLQLNPSHPDRYLTGHVVRYEGNIISRRGDTPHRVSLVEGKPVTTMFFTGPAWRDWGFATPLGWVPWREYNERIGHVDGRYGATG